jgi:hypothetical protein
MRFRFALIALSVYPCLAQDAARMDQIMQSYAADHFMGTALVARGNQVVFSKGYGWNGTSPIRPIRSSGWDL